MTASVIVPFNPDGAERSRNWEWLKGRLAIFHPELEVIVAGHEGERWCKAKAVAAGVERASHDTIVMMDADVFVEPPALERAIAEANDTTWVVPHTKVFRFAETYTERLLADEPSVFHDRVCCRELARKSYTGVAGGGLVVLTRSTWERVPLDPRFEGWFGEDLSWGDAMYTLIGPAKRYGADLFHLWHPEQPDKGSESRLRNQALRSRYRRALKRPHLMQRLVEEIPCARSVDASSRPAP